MKLFPKKSLGQNFLINQRILDKIIQAVEVEPEDIIIEVGPGTGNLTEKLAKKADQVIAIEKDRRLIELLKEKFKDSNIEIVEGDALEVDIGNLLLSSISLAYGRKVNYKVVGNIPYYITSNLLRTIFEKWPKPKLIVLTVQKEVAKRIVAKPPDMNLLALSVQFYSSPEIIGYVSKGSFRPMPKVDSAIIKLVPKKALPADKNLFFKLIKAGFAGKRRQLANNLGKNLGLPKDKVIGILKELGLDEKIRAENLSIEKWVELSHFL